MLTSKQRHLLEERFQTTDSGVLLDPFFEKRLKAFDPNLKLLFDQRSRRWHILVWRMDNSDWQVLIKAEDDNGNPKPLGDWVFNRLYVYRHNWEEKSRNFDVYWKNLIFEEEAQRAQIQRKLSEESQAKLMDDINGWRRAWRELNNEAPADVTAGYPKTQEKVCDQKDNHEKLDSLIQPSSN